MGSKGMVGYSVEEAIPAMGREPRLHWSRLKHEPEKHLVKFEFSQATKEKEKQNKTKLGLKSRECIFVIYFAKTSFILII